MFDPASDASQHGGAPPASGRGSIWWPTDYDPSPPEGPVDLVIPALNEADNLPHVLDAVPHRWIRRVVVVDNGSTDDTGRVAERAGAEVVREPQRGYGAACLAGLDHLASSPPEVVAFIDADFSDDPSQLPRVLAPIVDGDVDLSIGTRTVGARQPGALPPHAKFGNKLACLLMDLFFDYEFTDLGPFRAIRWPALKRLDMRDRDFGWTVEMQVKAARRGLSAAEVPVDYRRRRAGESKVTSTLYGSTMAGAKIFWTVLAEYARAGRPE
ncbi:MAG: glycosyltransferase family 2 protein [Bradymonadaceae bacterium]